jgi:hypothetical protein
MMFLSRRVVLIFALVLISLQPSPTAGSLQECSDQSAAIPVFTGSDSELEDLVSSECPSYPSDDCVVDVSSWSTDGDQNFASTCAGEEGTVFDVDTTTTCSSDAGTSVLVLLNQKLCGGIVCTPDNVADLLTYEDTSCTKTSIVTYEATAPPSPVPTPTVSLPGPTPTVSLPGPTPTVSLPGPTPTVSLPGPTPTATDPSPAVSAPSSTTPAPVKSGSMTVNIVTALYAALSVGVSSLVGIL